MDGEFYIYLVVSPSGRGYVGCTAKTVAIRWRQHVKDSRREAGVKLPLYRAIRKYGAGAMKVSTLEVLGSREEMMEAETQWILRLGTMRPSGMNCSTGGESPEYSEETRAKMSKSAKLRVRPPVSPEVRANMSRAQLDRWARPMTAAETEALSERMRKTAAMSPRGKRSPESVEKTAAAHRGKKRTPEQCARISAAITGRPGNRHYRATPETRAKQSAAQRRRFERERHERMADETQE